MKLNLTKLALTAGLSLGMISIASEAQAAIGLNGKSLTGQTTEKQFKQQFQGIAANSSSLTGQTTEKQFKQQFQGIGVPHNGSSLTGQTTEKQFKQQFQGITEQGSSLTGQSTDDEQPTPSPESPETSP